MVEENFQGRLITELAIVFEPLVIASAEAGTLFALFERFGWNLELLLGSNTQPFLNQVQAIVTAIESIQTTSPKSLSDFEAALKKARNAVQAINQLPTTLGNAQYASLKELPIQLLEYLLLLYLIRHLPWLYGMMVALTIVEEQTVAEEVKDGEVVREAVTIPRLKADRLMKLLQDPVGELKSRYMQTNLDTRERANQIADLLFPNVAVLLTMLGMNAVYGRGSDIPYMGDDVESILQGMLTFWLPILLAEGKTTEIGATLRLMAAADDGPGLLVAPFGTVTVAQPFEKWIFTLMLTGTSNGFIIKQDSVIILDTEEGFPGEVKLSASLARLSAPDSSLLLGSTTGTHLSVQQFAIQGDGLFNGSDLDYGLLITIGESKIVIKSDDGDGFLNKVLPKEPITMPFDLGIGWSNRKGLYFRGGAGLETTLPIHKDIFGIMLIESVFLALRAVAQNDAPTIDLIAAVTGAIKLGPFTATAERLGLKAKIDFPNGGGNLGVANLDLAFKAPDGIGINIDTLGISGGGHLFFDPDKQMYSGILQLSIKNVFSLGIIGILTLSKPPQKDFSLLLIVMADDFPPLQLGLGFSLNGVGGLLGVNRTANIDVLKAGIRSRTLDSVLFPKDIVRNAPKIIEDVSSAFPAADGRYIFGPMLKIGWGAPTPLITLDLGLILEMPAPIRIVILGQLRAALPRPEAPVVDLKMDILGIIDFDKGELSFDATIYDSRIAQFNVSGDMAMRLRWGTDPLFALSVGGFNPRFQPPPGFPSLRRLSIGLATGDNPRLQLDSYFAITSNTVQFGARLDAYAQLDAGLLGRFSASAYLGFDALVQFNPFQFVVDIYGGATIRRDKTVLFSVDIYIGLSGPKPWHAWGAATIEFLGKHEIPFEVTLGSGEPEPEPKQVNVLQDVLRPSFAEPRNWSAQLPPDGHALVTLRKIDPAGDVLAHPLGTLTFTQRDVPLGIVLDKFGGTLPLSPGPFSIVQITLGSTTVYPPDKTETATINRQYFARGQYVAMSDDDKLALPAFEQFTAGVTIGTSEVKTSADDTFWEYDDDLEYEEQIIGEFSEQPVQAYPLDGVIFGNLHALSAAGLARRSGGVQFYGPDKPVTLHNVRYQLATTDDLTSEGESTVTFTEARQALQQSGASNMQVVTTHEVSS